MSLQPLETEVYAKLCSSQVITDLKSAVKELVDNALDAGATSITLILEGYGLECVEVLDNGGGFSVSDYPLICLPHTTSKIQTFEDLELVETLGFRGEALSSLCALSRLVIRNSPEPDHVDRLEFNQAGELVKTSQVSGDSRTSIRIEELLCKTPVRRRHWEQNKAADLRKTVNMVIQAAVAHWTVSFHMEHLFEGKRKTLFASPGYTKFVDILSVFHLDLGNLVIREIQGDFYQLKVYYLKGGSKQRIQYCFVNKRPSELPQLAKVMKDETGSRFFILFLSIPTNYLDLNVSPDKVKVYVQRDVEVCEGLRAGLRETDVSNDWSGQADLEMPETRIPVQPASVLGTKAPARGNPTVYPFPSFRPSTTPAAKRKGVLLKMPLKVAKSENFSTPVEPADPKTPEPPESPVADPENLEEVLLSLPSKEFLSEGDSETRAGTPEEIRPEEPQVFQKYAPKRGRLHVVKETSFEYEPPQVFSEKPTNPPSKLKASSILDEIRFDKTYFHGMQIIGQFNHGFILAAYEGSVFIIDQHAADEKFRFENLNREAFISIQPLVSPYFLEIPPVLEEIISAHREVFKLNGFDLEINEDRQPGNRVQINGFPVQSNLHIFGPEDVMDLAYILSDEEPQFTEDEVLVVSDQGIIDLHGAHRRCTQRLAGSCARFPRPPKVWAHLASKACRSAIMIGTVLTYDLMRQVIHQLSRCEQPWHCPHGRPTLRFLCTRSL